MTEVAVPGVPQGVTARVGFGDVAWRVLAGTASGAIAGFFVGGIGGRLAMLLLRLTSPDSVIGLTSDDGFEIGVVSTETSFLLFSLTGLGAVVGALYAGLRGTIPERLRLPLWTAFWACVGGAGVVHDDGVDFNVLEPLSLAVALFIALPAVAAAVVVLLTERWSKAVPWQSRRLTAGLVVAAAASLFALVFALAVLLIMLAAFAVLERAGPAGDRMRLVARVVVPVVLVALSVVALLDLIPETRTIL